MYAEDVDAGVGQELGFLSLGRRLQMGSILRAPLASGEQGDPASRGVCGEIYVPLQDLHYRRVSRHSLRARSSSLPLSSS